MRNRLLLFFLVITMLAGCAPPGQPLFLLPAEGTALAGAAGDPASMAPDDLLPLDSSIRTGRLDNGLTYYIRHNTEPAKRAELWLVVDVGSILEDEDQLGLAHFIEHMLFNGTRRFAGQELIDFFEGVGMEFGPDINAYTSFDETVYTLQIPTDDETILITAFDVLEDWAAYATLDPLEIDKERGVIVEEWRLREQNAGARIRDQVLPVLLGGSRYAQRLPIGDMEVVRNAPPEALRRYYETWYRPDLMAVIAVGDIAVDRIESLIREHFASRPRPADPPERATFDVTGHAETRYLVAADPENTLTSLEISHQRPARQLLTAGDYRDLLAGVLFRFMFNDRLDELSRQADAPFLYAWVAESNLVRPVDAYSAGAQVEDQGVLAGLEALMTEVERVRRHGFTATELERARKNLLRFYQSAYADRENRDSSGYAREYRDHFLVGEASPGIEFELALVERLLPEITLDEVNALASNLVAEDNRSVVVVAPEKEGVALPGIEELATIIAGVEDKAIEPYVDALSATELMGQAPEPAAITAEQVFPEVGVTEFELANGVRALMKPTGFKEDEIIFSATSPGGSSLVSDADYPEANLAPFIVSQSGLGELSFSDLSKLLAGTRVGLSPSIGELNEGFSGGASPEDLELLFQLIYLYVTEPRADERAFATVQDQIRSFLVNRDLSPYTALDDALTDALYGDNIRFNVLPLEEVDALDLERSFQIYRDRFGDVSDFTFLFVGNFDPETLKGLAQSYLGTLPGAGRQETWRDTSPDLPQGIVERDVYKGQEEQSIVQLVFTGPIDPTPENRRRLLLLEKVLDILIREDLREERAGIYAAFISSSVVEEPRPSYMISISFSADPQRVDELVEAVFAQIEDVQTNGPSAENMAKVKEQEKRNYEEDFEENGFWLSLLEEYAVDPSIDLASALEYDVDIEEITAEEIRQAAQEFLPFDRYVRVVLYPEAYKP